MRKTKHDLSRCIPSLLTYTTFICRGMESRSDASSFCFSTCVQPPRAVTLTIIPTLGHSYMYNSHKSIHIQIQLINCIIRVNVYIKNCEYIFFNHFNKGNITSKEQNQFLKFQNYFHFFKYNFVIV